MIGIEASKSRTGARFRPSSHPPKWFLESEIDFIGAIPGTVFVVVSTGIARSRAYLRGQQAVAGKTHMGNSGNRRLDGRADEAILLTLPVRSWFIAERIVSFQITILKVLAGYPEGRARVADLTRDVSILMSSGSDWADRTKQWAARSPKLDIFGSAFVLRDDSGWQITDIGRQFLSSLEAPLPAAHYQERRCEVTAGVAPTALAPVQPVIRLVVDNTRTSQSDREHDQTRQTA
jgi:hypothetical protein